MSNETCGACLLIVIRELDPLKPVSGVREGTGQLRPYVRPVSRRSPLAIMGVRVRVRRQSE